MDEILLLTVIIQLHRKALVNPINIPPVSSESVTPQSPTPSDLMRCSRHIHGNVSLLASYLGITSTSLEEIERDYREVEAQAYWVLKKWQETTSSNVHHLHDVLQTLEFHKAAERYLCLLCV